MLGEGAGPSQRSQTSQTVSLWWFTAVMLSGTTSGGFSESGLPDRLLTCHREGEGPPYRLGQEARALRGDLV
jgi:hypothetical protein